MRCSITLTSHPQVQIFEDDPDGLLLVMVYNPDLDREYPMLVLDLDRVEATIDFDRVYVKPNQIESTINLGRVYMKPNLT